MRFNRVIIASILILLLFLVCSNYASNEEYHSTVNELVFYSPDNQLVSGIITEVYPDGFQVSVDDKKGNYINYRVITSFKVELSDGAYVLGTLNSPNVITGEKIVTVKRSEFKFVIIRSIVGFILFLIIFLTYWKFNFKTFNFTRLKENQRFSQPQNPQKISDFLGVRKMLCIFLNFLKKILRRK